MVTSTFKHMACGTCTSTPAVRRSKEDTRLNKDQHTSRSIKREKILSSGHSQVKMI